MIHVKPGSAQFGGAWDLGMFFNSRLSVVKVGGGFNAGIIRTATTFADGVAASGFNTNVPTLLGATTADGGEIVLAGPTTDGAVTFGNHVNIVADGTLTAGPGGSGAPGPVAVTLGGLQHQFSRARQVCFHERLRFQIQCFRMLVLHCLAQP